MMKEEEIRKLAEDYIDSCTKKSGFVILAESLKGDFIDLFVAGFMKCLEINKADEWHYTKCELPSEDVPLLCMRGGNVYVAWFILGKWKGDKYNDVKKPYAWKYVVLPEPGLQMPMQEG